MNLKSQLDEVAIGEKARVQCAKIYSPPIGAFAKIIQWIPILPYPFHEDREIIGFSSFHYHFDFRFWSDPLIDLFFFQGEKDSDWQVRVQLAEEVIEVREMVRLCHRDMPVLSADYHFIPRLEKAYSDCKLLPGNICPHKGYKVYQTGVCPGHGLAFNLSSGRLRRRRAL